MAIQGKTKKSKKAKTWNIGPFYVSEDLRTLCRLRTRERGKYWTAYHQQKRDALLERWVQKYAVVASKPIDVEAFKREWSSLIADSNATPMFSSPISWISDKEYDASLKSPI